MKCTHFLTLLLGITTLSSLHTNADTVSNNWYTFLTEDLAALSAGTATSAIFEATGDVRLGASWTGNNGTVNNPIPGTVVMDGKGYAMNGAGYMFGGNYPKYSGELIIRNWSDWNGCVQTGNNNAPLFQPLGNPASGNITVQNSTFSDNQTNVTAKILGAVLNNGNSSGSATPGNYGLTVSGSTFSNTTATDSSAKFNGLVIYNTGYATVSDSDFNNNKASSSTQTDRLGAAIYNTRHLELTNVNFSGNEAADGGAIYNLGKIKRLDTAGIETTLSISGGNFKNNAAADEGGALYNSGLGTITIANVSFSGNTAEDGGAIFDASSNDDYSGTYVVSDTTFSGNAATNGNGGAINSGSHNLWQVEKSTFSGNTTAASNSSYGYGGAVYLGTDTQASFVDTDFTNNSSARANSGAALHIGNKSTVTLAAQTQNVTISGNLSGTGATQADGTTAISFGNASSGKLYLNADEGKSISFTDNGITGYYKGTSVYINSANADSDVITEGIQSAGTTGTVTFSGADTKLSNLNLIVEGGTLNLEGSTVWNSNISVADGASVSITNSDLAADPAPDYNSKPTIAQTTLTLGDGACAIISDSSITLGESVTPFTMSSSASLTFSGTLTIALDALYDSLDDIVIDKDFTLQLVQFTDTAEEAAIPMALFDNSVQEPGLHAENMTVVLTYEGEKVARMLVTDESAFTGTGTLSFALPVPEPTTATLSLLALAGFAARRRRK